MSLSLFLKEMEVLYPDVRITLLTRETFRPFFISYGNIKLFTPDFKERHSGISGLVRLFADIRKGERIDFVIDLHDVLRSMFLRFLFHISGVPVKKIDKGRHEKRYLITGKKRVWLKHSANRYRDVFIRAGFDLKPVDGPFLLGSPLAASGAVKVPDPKQSCKVGVAPYALHRLKLWPEEYIVNLLRQLRERAGARFWLFGGREEAGMLEALGEKVPGSVVVSGKLSLGEEITLITKLDFMISMDSSNMHMAALTGTKVISIWCATDPMAGFGAWLQPEEYAVRIPVEKLTCRPCTVYGKGSCKRGDHACMVWLTPDIVLRKIEDLGIIRFSK
jgi:ADP-heptose:LPS heptosyltransferase